MPFCHAELRASKPKPDHYPKEINTLGDHIRKRRLDLKLLQKQVADQIGVDGTTITAWERNTTSPAVRFIPAIIQFLGYDPLPEGNSFSEHLATARRVQGLSLRKMAVELGIDPGTLLDWESGKHKLTKKSLDLVGRVLPSQEQR